MGASACRARCMWRPHSGAQLCASWLLRYARGLASNYPISRRQLGVDNLVVRIQLAVRFFFRAKDRLWVALARSFKHLHAREPCGVALAQQLEAGGADRP